MAVRWYRYRVSVARSRSPGARTQQAEHRSQGARQRAREESREPQVRGNTHTQHTQRWAQTQGWARALFALHTRVDWLGRPETEGARESMRSRVMNASSDGTDDGRRREMGESGTEGGERAHSEEFGRRDAQRQKYKKRIIRSPRVRHCAKQPPRAAFAAGTIRLGPAIEVPAVPMAVSKMTGAAVRSGRIRPVGVRRASAAAGLLPGGGDAQVLGRELRVRPMQEHGVLGLRGREGRSGPRR